MTAGAVGRVQLLVDGPGNCFKRLIRRQLRQVFVRQPNPLGSLPGTSLFPVPASPIERVRRRTALIECFGVAVGLFDGSAIDLDGLGGDIQAFPWRSPSERPRSRVFVTILVRTPTVRPMAAVASPAGVASPARAPPTTGMRLAKPCHLACIPLTALPVAF